jgi:hypothetical protein
MRRCNACIANASITVSTFPPNSGRAMAPALSLAVATPMRPRTTLTAPSQWRRKPRHKVRLMPANNVTTETSNVLAHMIPAVAPSDRERLLAPNSGHNDPLRVYFAIEGVVVVISRLDIGSWRVAALSATQRYVCNWRRSGSRANTGMWGFGMRYRERRCPLHAPGKSPIGSMQGLPELRHA